MDSISPNIFLWVESISLVFLFLLDYLFSQRLASVVNPRA
jgi:hypothetical protein